MSQLYNILKDLSGEIGQRCINPNTILIKYTNEKKNNFDVYLSENGIFEFENNLSSFFYYHPTIIENRIKFKRKFEKIDIEIRLKNELFNIGMTLYELYFNNVSFYKESDYQLYEDIFENNINIKDLKFDPIKYPLLEIEMKKWSPLVLILKIIFV